MIYLLILICLFSGNLHSAGSGADFLKISPSAVSSGMGGAGVAVAMGNDSMYLNPSATALAKDKYLASFNHIEWFENTRVENLIFSMRSNGMAFGAGLLYLYMPALVLTDISGTPTGENFKIDDSLAHFNLAYTAGRLALGTNIKGISRNLGDYNATAVAVDLGMLYKTESISGLSYGVSIQNVGTKIKFDSIEEDLPLITRLGVAFDGPLRTIYAFDYEINDDKSSFHTGIESRIKKILKIRAGYENNDEIDGLTGITFGFGIDFSELTKDSLIEWGEEQKYRYMLDYALRIAGDLGYIHRISVNFAW